MYLCLETYFLPAITNGKGGREVDRKRVILIGDRWETQMLAACALEGAGYDAITLFDKRRAVEAVKDIKPDLVLLDMDLPKLRSVQIVRSLRRDAATQNVPIIGIVSSGEEQAVVGRFNGLADVFPQPFDKRTLLRKVRKVLRDGRTERNGR